MSNDYLLQEEQRLDVLRIFIFHFFEVNKLMRLYTTIVFGKYKEDWLA
jgi:hypothetical protein